MTVRKVMTVAIQSMATTPEMQQAATRFADAEERCRHQLVLMENSMGALTAGWTGPAAAKFQQTMAQWATDFNTIVANLNAIKDRLQGAAVKYDALEGANQDEVSALQSALAGAATIKPMGA
jgi:WXG100 family type VII secretion target